jgi:hypothetical protein
LERKVNNKVVRRKKDSKREIELIKEKERQKQREKDRDRERQRITEKDSE